MELTELKLFGPAGYLLADATYGPAGVRGADKVAQRFVYALMTPEGSVPGLPQAGSPFLNLVRNFRSEFDLYAAYATAYASAVGAVRAAETAGEAASERFRSASLVGVTVTDDGVVLRLTVTAVDGSRPADPVDVTLET